MTNKGGKDRSQATAHTRNSRADRLKLALRENLKRRKTQARERSKTDGAPSNGDEASLHEGGAVDPDT